jgi:hypothetical protein
VTCNDCRACAGLVLELGRREQLPVAWTAALANALATDDWTYVGRQFAHEKFIGRNAFYLLAGPYTIARGGRRLTRLSLSVGRVLPHRVLIPQIEQVSRHLFGAPRQRVPRVIPVCPVASAGFIGGEVGEAFVVPDGWSFPRSSQRPAINDMPT